MSSLNTSYMLIDGPYASIDRPLLVGSKQAKLLRESGYKVVTNEEYAKLLKELRVNNATTK